MNVTRLLERARDGDRAAVDALIEASTGRWPPDPRDSRRLAFLSLLPP